jgi:hypothetical protein
MLRKNTILRFLKEQKEDVLKTIGYDVRRRIKR